MIRKLLVHPLQAAIIMALIGVTRLLPVTWASALGGWMFRCVGPFLPADRVARQNLERALPELSGAERDAIRRGVWDSLGRGAGEWLHVLSLYRGPGDDRHVELIGAEHFAAALQSGRPIIVVSGHIANWELGCVIAARNGLRLANVYRSASNPWLDRWFRRYRSFYSGELIPKGRQGAKAVLKVLAGGGAVGMLIDQKLNEGWPIPFFGRDAMTATAPAELALRMNCVVLPLRLERLGGVQFRMTVLPPMELPDGPDRKANARELLTRMNAMLEDWVRADPKQWFWVHRRWPKDEA